MTEPPQGPALRIDVRSKSSAGSFEAGLQEPLLYAALRAGLGIPYECATGTCGTCRARLLAGEVVDDWAAAPGRIALKPGRNEVLLCQNRALGACSFEIPGNPGLAANPHPTPRFGQAVLDRLEPLTADVAALHLRLKPALDFTAGQFAVLRVPGIDGFRAYSMVSAAGQADRVEFVVKRKPGGAIGAWLSSTAAPGDRLEWFGPLGKAVFDPQDQRPLLCIAGGSGIAPILSILAAGCSTGHFARFGAAVYFGVRTRADLFYLDRLSGFAAAFPGALNITVALSDDAPTDALQRLHPLLGFAEGFPHALAARDLAGHFAGRVAYLAGPPILVEASIRMLIAEARLPVRDIRYDKFS
jgi:toluene monooxygenase electron transfer component